MKNETMNQNATTEMSTTNPFQFVEEQAAESKGRRLAKTEELQTKARTRATELIKTVSTDRIDLAPLAAEMQTGDTDKLLELITAVFPAESIHDDADEVLTGVDDDELGRMLESQRSNRSKAKKQGLKSKLTVLQTYVASMYAELMIRDVTGKPYTKAGRSIAVDMDALKDDPDLLKRRINSLASKKSRLTKLAEYDEEAKTELTSVEAELEELRALRPAATKTVIKGNIKAAELREALMKLDPETLPEDVRALVEKLA